MPHDPLDGAVRPSDSEPDGTLSAAEEDEVRRLLADAQVRAPMPAEVAARLDWVISDLSSGGPGHRAGPADEHDAAPGVVPLAKRRHRARGLLVAAAAVVAVGVAGGQLLAPGADQAGDSAAAGEAAADVGGSIAGRAGAEEDAESGEATAPQLSSIGRAELAITAAADPVEVDSETFTRDVTRLRRQRFVGAYAAADRDQALGAHGPGRDESRSELRAQGGAAQRDAPAEQPGWFSCTPADWGRGRLVAVLYDGDPAVLAFRPRTGETQVVELLQCSSGEVLRSVTLPTG